MEELTVAHSSRVREGPGVHAGSVPPERDPKTAGPEAAITGLTVQKSTGL